MTRTGDENRYDDELDAAFDVLVAGVRTDEGELASRRVALLAAAADPEPAGTGAPLRRRRRLLAAAAAILVLGAGGVAVETVPFGDRPARSSAAAAGLDAAARLIASSDPAVRPGQYLHITSRGWALAESRPPDGRVFSWLEEAVYEYWVPARWTDVHTMRNHTTGRRRWVLGSEQEAKAAGILLGPAVPIQGLHRARCREFHLLRPGQKACTIAGGWQFPTPAWWAGLPRDPRQLYERLQHDAPDNSHGDAEALVYATDALRSGLLPADVRSSLYRALAMIPGLEVTDGAANLDGRIGVAYGMDDGAIRQEVIIDPKNGQFIGERQVFIDGYDGIPAGTIFTAGSTTTSVVDKAPTR